MATSSNAEPSPHGKTDNQFATTSSHSHDVHPTGQYEDGYVKNDPPYPVDPRLLSGRERLHKTFNHVVGRIEQALGKIVHSRDLEAAGTIRRAYGEHGKQSEGGEHPRETKDS